MDQQRGAGGAACVDHLLRGLKRVGKWLLTDGGNAVLGGKPNEAHVRCDVGDDVDKIELFVAQQVSASSYTRGTSKSRASASALLRVRL